MTVIGLPVLGWVPDDGTNTNYTDGRHVHYEYFAELELVNAKDVIKADYIRYDPYTCLYSAEVTIGEWSGTLAVSKYEERLVCHMVKIIFDDGTFEQIMDYNVVGPISVVVSTDGY